MVESERIRILADSVSDIPKTTIIKHKIGILPIYVSVDQQHFLDDGTVDREWFYKQLTSVSVKPKTAAPSPEEIIHAFDHLFSDGAQVIVGLFASASISSIFDIATIAARDFDPARIHIIDTGHISMGLGWIVVSVAEAKQAGATVDEIELLVKDLRKRTVVFGVLNSMDYLHRSGRVG